MTGSPKDVLRAPPETPPRSAMRNANIKLPREGRTVTSSIHLFEPAVPGRPPVPWTEGLDPDLVREQWPCWSDELPNPMTIMAWYRKLVIYEKSNPAIRLVILLSDPETVGGKEIQHIVKYALEWEPSSAPKAIEKARKKLLDEFCKVQLRGRPRGTGHPKRSWRLEIPNHELALQKLRKAGLDDRDVRILYSRLNRQSFAEIARELKITPQAVHQRFKLRIEPRLRRLKPHDGLELRQMMLPPSLE